MKKPVICSFLIAAFLASCSTPASSSGSFSSSRPNSSSSSTSYVPYSSSSDEVLEEEITPIIGYDEDARIDGNLLYGSDDRFPLRSEAPLERSQGGSLILEQGMILENDLAYSSIVGVRVQFVSTNSLDVLYAKGSYWSIDNGAIGATLVQNNILCEFDQDTRYFSLYAPLGDVLIESITLYTSYTPDAMDRLFSSFRQVTQGGFIALFGASGERDRSKRRAMGEVAGHWCRQIVLSEDDPRAEGAESIAREIAKGITGRAQCRFIERREEAVAYALSLAREGDVVFLLGMGHERTLDYGDHKRAYDEGQVARKILKEIDR